MKKLLGRDGSPGIALGMAIGKKLIEPMASRRQAMGPRIALNPALLFAEIVGASGKAKRCG